MNRLHQIIVSCFTLLAASTLFGVMGCKSSASVACTQVERFQARSGVVNIPHLKIGDVILLDTLKKVGEYILHCQISDSNISATPPIDSIEILTSTGFTIDLQGKVSKAKTDVQANVRSSISNNTTFFLSNSIRKNVVNPTTEINNISVFPSLKSAVQNNSNVICIFVSGVVYADKFEFRIKKSVQAEANANIIKVGDFKVNVTYDCSGSLVID